MLSLGLSGVDVMSGLEVELKLPPPCRPPRAKPNLDILRDGSSSNASRRAAAASESPLSANGLKEPV